MTVEPTAKPRPVDGIGKRDLGQEYVFYDQRGEQFKVLNGTAREIYLLCDGTRTVDEVAQELTERYEVDEATARADTRKLVDELIQFGLLALA